MGTNAVANSDTDTRPSPIRARPAPQPDGESAPVIKLTARASAPAPAPPVGKRATTGGKDPADDEELKHVTAVARSVGQAAVETIGGARPVQRLARWLDDASFERLQLRTQMVRQLRKNPAATSRAHQLYRNPVVHSVKLCPVADGIYEATLIVAEQTRVRALALRIELIRDLWKITALELG